MWKVNMVASISRPYHDGVLFERHLLDMGDEQREICRRQRGEKAITGARRTFHHERLPPSEEHAALLQGLWQECLRCANTNSTFILFPSWIGYRCVPCFPGNGVTCRQQSAFQLRLICAKQQNAVRDGTSSKELSVGRFPLAHTSPDPPDREKVEANRQTPRANIPNQTDFGPAWEPGSSVL